MVVIYITNWQGANGETQCCGMMPRPGASDNLPNLQPPGVFFMQPYQPRHQCQHIMTPGLVSLLVSISWQGRSAAVSKMSAST